MIFARYILLSLIFIPVLLSGQDLDETNQENTASKQQPKVEIKSKIKTWTIAGNGSDLNFFEMDTLQDKFQIFHPIEKKSITTTYTGNYGDAYEDNNFFGRKYNTDFLLLQNHDAYLLTPDNVVYYNTTTPYSVLDYSQSENKSQKNETRFNVLHTQNINPNWNFAFRFDQARSMGQYENQYAKNNFVSVYTTYVSDKFNTHAGYIANRINNELNGGLKNDEELYATVMTFNLIGTEAKYKSDYFYLSSEYKLGKYSDSTDVAENDSLTFIPRYGFGYYFEYSNNTRTFTEDAVNFDFFPVTFPDSIGSADSVRFGKFTNIFQVKQFESAKKFASFEKRAYLGFDIVNIFLTPYDVWVHNKDHYTDFYIGGSLARTTGKFWDMKFEGRFYFTGYHSGQTEISGIISKPMILLKDSAVAMEISGTLENRVPDYFQSRFLSNHFTWFNHFSHEQRMTAGIVFRSPKRHFEMGANYALINNFIYNDTLGLPAQTNKELLILAAFLNKKFVLGNFNIDTKLLAQKASSSDLVHLPEFSAYLGMYYKFVLAKVMFTQIGVDTRYNTKYYADAYSPATGFFYLQNEKELGNYPYIDVYASLKLKRTRLFFKLMNVGTSFMKEDIFTALHYPMNKMTFRLGVDWKFYD